MKKIIFSAAVAAMLCCACTDGIDEVATAPKADTFHATMKTTRTVMGDENAVLWIENDPVTIFNKTTDNLKYAATEVTGTSATLKHQEGLRGEKTLDNNYAIYPYDAAATLAGDVLSTSIAKEQTHDADANLQYAVMVAKSADNSFTFQNATSLIRIEVKTVIAGTVLKNIKVVSASKDIAGDVEIDMSAATPKAVVKSNGAKEITLDCGNVILNDKYTVFYIALAETEFPANDLKIVYTANFDGDDHIMEYPVKSAIKFNAGQFKTTKFTISEDFDGNTSVIKSYADEVVEALNAGQNVTLAADVELEETLVISSGTATLNLNGKTITNKADNATTDVLIVEEGATLTIDGEGTIEAVSGNDGFTVIADGTVIINGGTFKSGVEASGDGNCTIYARGNGKVYINGGNFSTPEGDDETYVLNKKDADRATTVIEVKGGTFRNFNPANNIAEGTGTNFLAEGYSSVELTPGVWTVMEGNYSTATNATLQDVITSAKQSNEPVTILLSENISDANISVPSGADVTIQPLNSEEIMMRSSTKEAFIQGYIKVSGKLTLKDVIIYGPEVATAGEVSQFSKSAIAVTADGEVVAEDCIFDLSSSVADATAITAWWSVGDGANINVKNCVFNCAGQRPIRSDACVTVEGCTFNDQYRYSVQMTSKSSTMEAEAEAYVNFKNNVINAGSTSSKPVYGVQLEGGSYGCSDLTINGSGNTINLGTTGKTSAMYYCDCGKVDHSSVVWNTEVAPVHETGYSVKDNTYYITSAEGLVWFANQVNVNKVNFSGKTVVLTADIDLKNMDWEPIGQTGNTQFNGTFDGNGKTIYNLSVNSEDKDDDGHYASGLFGWTEGGTIKNVKIDGATIVGGHLCAAVIGYISGSVTIDGCHVTNATITCKELDDNDDDPEGDKAACIVGQIGGDESKVNDCHASTSTVSAGRDAGQVVGAALGTIANGVTNCTATNVTVSANGTSSGKNINNTIIGRTN